MVCKWHRCDAGKLTHHDTCLLLLIRRRENEHTADPGRIPENLEILCTILSMGTFCCVFLALWDPSACRKFIRFVDIGMKHPITLDSGGIFSKQDLASQKETPFRTIPTNLGRPIFGTDLLLNKKSGAVGRGARENSGSANSLDAMRFAPRHCSWNATTLPTKGDKGKPRRRPPLREQNPNAKEMTKQQ